MEISQKNESVESRTPLESSFSELWLSFINFKTTEEWRKRMLRYIHLFYEGIVLENEIRVKRLSSFGEYSALSPLASGLEMFYALIEFANEAEITHKDRCDPAFLGLPFYVNSVVSLQNDVHAFGRGEVDDESANLVSLLQRETLSSNYDAMHNAADRINEWLISFYHTDKYFVYLMPEGDNSMKKFMHGLKAFIKGNEDYNRY
ncbi:hypothetical protein B4U79_16525 [Dinothrombium tinctorium]|uniref:Uncharacterized protein n=1 Tax=Dinothrombium tinctorium TaxID=1965070 RepID=A0A443QK04_9ACAR|nr:hypothetical protein B4U79_16525 [Dinothrombium tinctorium]